MDGVGMNAGRNKVCLSGGGVVCLGEGGRWWADRCTIGWRIDLGTLAEFR